MTDVKKSVVALVACSDYEQDAVNRAIARGFELCGGTSRFVTSGERIVLKPNALGPFEPDRAATTHPVVFEAVIKHLQNEGVTVSYGESPGIGVFKEVINVTGLAEVAERMAIEADNFEIPIPIEHPNALIKKKFPIAKAIADADGLISISKCKTHGMARFTGAVKNQYGCIPGSLKARLHAEHPLMSDFCSLLVDINTYIKPRFYIMDAVWAMEGNGPASGEPRNLGLLLFSDDPVALDATVARLVHMNPDFIPTNRAGEKAGLGTWKEEQIELRGDPFEQFIDKKFKITRTPAFMKSGTGIRGLISKMFMPKPVIIKKRCTQCGNCIRICPVDPKCVTKPPGSKVPVYSYDRCIRCFCCQEACPSKAIEIKIPAGKPLLSVVYFLGFMGYGVIFQRIRRFLKKKLSRSGIPA